MPKRYYTSSLDCDFPAHLKFSNIVPIIFVLVNIKINLPLNKDFPL